MCLTTKLLYRYLEPKGTSFDDDGAAVFHYHNWRDLLQEARMWVLEAEQKYDPFKGTKFSTFVYTHLKLKTRWYLSLAKRNRIMEKSYRKEARRSIYIERVADDRLPTIEMDKVLNQEELNTWNTIIAKKDTWGTALLRKNSKWSKNVAGLISNRTGVPIQDVRRLFRRIQAEAVPDPVPNRPEHWRNGVKYSGAIFA